MKHSLIIGGTGMLREASDWLIAESDVTLMVARSASRRTYGTGRVEALGADWNSADFKPKVQAAINAHPGIDRALLWLHDPAPILSWLCPMLPNARTVVVLGSTDGRPELLQGLNKLTFVQLGSVVQGGHRRWLTHAEISAGAISAMQDGRSIVVGQLAGLQER